MSERELKSLKGLPVPAPSADAKAAALRAALGAYDSAAGTMETSENNAHQPKGDEAQRRPTHMNIPQRRSFMMRLSSSHYAIAASLAAAFVAVPAGLYYVNQERTTRVASGGGLLGTFSTDSGNTPAPARRDEDRPAERRALELAKPATAPVAVQPQASPPMKTEEKAAAEPPVAAPSSTRLAAQLPPQDAKTRQFGFTGGVRSFDRLSGVPAGHLGRLQSGEAKDASPKLYIEDGRDRFDHVADNPVKQVATDPVSTFSIDVDTASYGFVRRALSSGSLPPADAVRVEEMVNYFDYGYARPESADAPFQPTVTVLPSLWNPDSQLVHIAIQGYELKSAERPRANLVFLVDVSGSMASPDKLPLVKSSLRLLLDNLRPDDTVGLVTYASGSGVALEPTRVADKGKILAAIDALGAGGSTAGAAGIEDAYRLIEQHFDKAAVNRVILATDGDFNVGVSDHNQLKSIIERKRDAGVFLSILGVGAGNYNDQLMQTLAQNGNGTAAYIDTLNEARKVLVEEASSTLFPIAKDVKIQVEFNPAEVAEYRLVGYETRALRREDFNNDKIDAGDVGSGHSVTAIYEITPVGRKKLVDDLRYGSPAAEAPKADPVTNAKPGELGYLKLRYKLPKEDKSRLIELPIRAADALPRLDAASSDIRFATAVATFGQMLKGGKWTGAVSYDDVIALAQGAKGDDPFGLRAEFVNLVRIAKSLK